MYINTYLHFDSMSLSSSQNEKFFTQSCRECQKKFMFSNFVLDRAIYEIM